ncbi:unnamed protein product [Diatraea saccharalis]|uniref:BPTI/Kunitz inhibitor domain-containing protein n=1 Tax=Diatraea saccharalis TaxID=40085 RepID=A0A9N9RDC6_9NEOP|nr:unnamed protein product [Diatraea saccharalis]
MFKLYHLVLIVLFFELSQAKEDRCNHQIDAGLCYGNVPVYAFDSNTGSCTDLAYGGCGGNDNNFKTLEECRSACEN